MLHLDSKLVALRSHFRQYVTQVLAHITKLIVFAFWWCSAFLKTMGAESSDWILRRFEPPSGVNFEEVRDIEFGEQGSIWFGSWGNGIACLRESEWKAFSVEDGQLPSNFVPSLSWDAGNGVMWAGTDEGLVAVIENRSFVVELPPSLAGDGFEITLVKSFDTGELWIGSRLGKVLAGMPVVDQGVPRLTGVREVVPTAGDHGHVVRGILKGRDGSVWIARNRGGVLQWHDGGWTHHSALSIGIKRNDSIFEGTDGSIWVSGSDNPVFFDGEQWRAIEAPEESKYFTEGSDGLFYLAAVTGEIFPAEVPGMFAEPLTTWSDVVVSRISVINAFRGRLLWVGTKEGILLGTRPRLREVSLGEGESEAGGKVAGFYTSNKQSPLVLRSDGTLMNYASRAGEWQSVVKAFDAAASGGALIDASQGGVCWLRSGDELVAVELVTGTITTRVQLPPEFELFDLACDRNGVLFLAGDHGGYRLEESQWVRVFEEEPIYSLSVAKNGDMLLALDVAIRRWREGAYLETWEGKNRNPLHPFTFAEELSGGDVMAGTRGLGLKVFGDQGEETISVRDDLLSSRIIAACETQDGSLWLGFENLGVAVRRGGRWLNYSSADGLRAKAVRFIGEDPNHHMWVAKSDGALYRFEGDRTPPDTKINDAAPVIGPGEIGIIGFEGYDAWGHTSEEDLEYSWCLIRLGSKEEKVDDWSPYARSRSVSLPRELSPGSYRFEVRSQDRDFNTDPTPATHVFEVLPPIWARAVFLIPVTLLGGMALVLALRLQARNRDLQRHSQHMDETVRLRTRELENANHLLASEKERLMVTLTSIGDGLVVTDEQAHIVIFNPVAERLIGYSEGEARGRRFEDIVQLRRVSENSLLPSPVWNVLEKKEIISSDGDVAIASERGPVVEVSYSCAPIFHGESEIVGCVFAMRDISHLRRLEEETVRASRLDSLGLLAGGIAHDFNNFLTAIMGNISFATMHKDATPELRKILEESEAASHRASALTQQLLTFSKGGAPVKTKTSISDAIRDSVEFSLRGSVVKPDFDIPNNLFAVEVDPGQLAQVLQNLTLNAVQAMSAGGSLSVRARNVTKMVNRSERDFVELRISDEGSGISTQDMDRVFDPYFTTKETGNGLGLSVCYSIMKRHEGEISIQSIEGQGTTVTLQFPAKKSASPTRYDTSEDSECEVKSPEQFRVLVMDDEAPIRELLSRILARLNHDCVVSAHGAEAVEQYVNAHEAGRAFEVVILDLTIQGGMGGVETVGKILEIDSDAICIASSGYSEDPVLAHYRDYGFAGALKKPYGVEIIQDVLHRAVLSKRSGGSAVSRSKVGG